MGLEEKSDAMAAEPTGAVEVYYSYAPEDERWQKELEKQLSGLKRKGLIVDWHKRRISAGIEKASEINAHLNTAAIILLLVSPDFIASDYCYGFEMKRAMERHERREARVIPIILRPTDKKGTPFDKLQALPANDKPITKWSNRDDAWLDVVKGIRENVETLILQKSQNQRTENNLAYSTVTHYDVALSYASEDRSYAESLAKALRQRGVKVFYDQYEKSAMWGQNLYTYLSDLYQNQARYSILFLSQHYASKLWTSHEREAAQARAFKEQGEYILPIRLDDTEIPGLLPTIAYLSWPPETAESIADAVVDKLRSQKTSEEWLEEGNRYCQIDWYNDALVAYEHAIHLNPKNAGAYNNKSWALNQLDRYEEALIASEQALHLDPHLSAAHANRQIALTGMQDVLDNPQKGGTRDSVHKPIERSKEQVQLENFAEYRPVLVPEGTPVFQDNKPQWLNWNINEQTLAIRNIGPGEAFNVASVIYGCESYLIDWVTNRRSNEANNIHWTCWLGVSIASQMAVKATYKIGNGIFYEKNKHVGQYGFNAPPEPRVNPNQNQSFIIARIIITYLDIYRHKHASIFDYIQHNDGWQLVEFLEDIREDLHDLVGR